MRLLRLSLFCLTVCLLGAVGDTARAKTTILFTGCVNARLENCRCPKDPLGALEKVSAEVNRQRELGEVLLLDSGDFCPSTRDNLGANISIQAMSLLEYDAVALGDQELLQHPDQLQFMQDQLPLVCANVSDSNGKAVTKPFRLIDRGGSTFFVSSLIQPETVSYVDPSLLAHLTITDPTEAYRGLLAHLPENANFILLSHAGKDRDLKLAVEWKEVDLIIGSHTQDVLDGSESKIFPAVLQAGGGARYLGMAQMRGKKVRAEIVEISPNLPDDERILALVKELYKGRREQGNW